MRKASHDGADSSSITSGMDNDSKKPATNFNKMKKSSIKRKVQHFSHESDDGIIEPLLQSDKEKSEIANISAKFLLNKSKTESLHEKDNKATDGYAETCSVSIPLSSTSNMITNNVKQSPITTSYVCGSAPIHNHMNTNMFSAYDSSTGMTTTKSPILVEIDNTKSVIYSPSPLIFTTAKIHTDSKTKLMEPVQVTPVPILSTVEGNIIKAGIVNNAETTKTSSTSMMPTDHMKVLSGKYEVNDVSQARSDPFSTVSHPNKTVKNESHPKSFLESSANLLYKDEKCQFQNTVSKSKLGSNDSKALKEQPITDVVSNSQKNISVSDTVKQSIEISKSVGNTSEKYSLLDKEKQSFLNMNNKDIKILQAPINSQNQINTHNINLKSSDKQQSYSKDSEHINSSDFNNKKLQRQSKLLSEASNVTVGKIMKTQNTPNLIENKEKKLNEKSDKEATSKIDHQNPVATKDSNKITSSVAQTSKGTTPSTEIKAIPSTVPSSISKEQSFTEPINSKPTLIGGSKDVSKPSASVASTAQSGIRYSKESTIISTNPALSPLTSTKVTTTTVCGKPNVVPSSYSSSQSVKTEPSNSIVTVINTTLPSYIVSTSRTKIGSTLTCNTSAIASKSQIKKPLVNVSTASAQVKSFETPIAKSAPSTSAVNGTKHTNITNQTKSPAEAIKKDGRV